ncbi:nuclease-related domain-containing protein [Haloferula helveola]|uniref:DNA 3'-5' helicase II n=1 Tax=Haloferula helveola TaxID=490095 RepID=A0ABM7RB98_9BACT|nr:nuclease-related domain-containing protein [Haloferula helveola]
MARLIPSTCPEKAPPGEKLLFRRLRDDPDAADWIVLHSLDLARHVNNVAGEADFVVIVPELGILVVEVKSHKTAVVDDDGWHLGHDPVDLRGPFKQASEAMHSIREYLLGIDSSFGSLVMWSAASFPRCDFRQKSPEWHDWQVIDRSRITSAPLSRIIAGILSKGRAILESRNVSCARDPARHASRERCDAVAGALRPRFEVALSPKGRRKELDEDLLSLTEEQFTALDQAALNPRVIFSGPAGSGKTVLAMEALRRKAVSGEARNPALFCFNKLLGNDLFKRTGQILPGVQSGHLDGWLYEIAKDRLSPGDRDDPDFFNGLLASRAIDALLDDPGFKPFDFIVLDEAQDLLKPHLLDVLDLMLEGGLAAGRWCMFGDFVGQDIFCKGSMGMERFIEERSPSASRFLLNTNCRNTRAISEYIVTLGKLDPPYARVLRPDDRMDPELEFWSSDQDQIAQAADFVERCLADGFKPSDIVLLSPKGKGSLGRKLESDPAWRGRIGAFPAGDGRIGYSTIHGFKGLEAPVVLVTDFEKMDDSTQQSLFYIGLSRALHRLGVFLHEDLKQFVRDTI